MRVSVVGNAGGGKSTLSRRLAKKHKLELYEIDSLLWQKGWKLTPRDIYSAEHQKIIGSESWLIEGLGRQESIRPRLEKSTHIILIDLPLWQHYWLVAERHVAGIQGEMQDAPGGHGEMPPLRAIFKTIADVDANWMPQIRSMIDGLASSGTVVFHISDYQKLGDFSLQESSECYQTVP